MRNLLLAATVAVTLLVVSACGGAETTDCGDATEHVAECGARSSFSTCDACGAGCYDAASCHEIRVRLDYPQPGEASGATLYSALDVCLAGCPRD